MSVIRGGKLALCLLLLGSSAAPAQVAGGGAGAAPLAGCGTDLIYLNQITGWQQAWSGEWSTLAAASPDAQAEARQRWKAAAGAVANDQAALAAGLASGRAAPAPVVRRVLEQLNGLLSQPLAPQLTAPEWRQLLDQEIRPAIESYRTFLRDVYLPKAPDGGLASLPDGPACFRRAAENWTSLKMSPAEIEATGERLLARYRKELSDLTGLPDRDIPAYLETLRNDRGTATREDIVRVSEAAITRAQAALPQWFDVASIPPLKVEPISAQIENSVPAGYYDIARNGRDATYYINLSRPGERRLMAEVIAFHEGLPGHHLSFSVAPPEVINSGLVEGWAIYSEHLADEMGLYSTKQDRIGMVVKHLWAASRLVVEPGLHVHGWSRDRAIAFMRANTALPEEEIAIEVDRYLGMPGQSLAYMLGHDAIERARDAFRQKQGDKFDIRAFHRAILSPEIKSLQDVVRLAQDPAPLSGVKS